MVVLLQRWLQALDEVRLVQLRDVLVLRPRHGVIDESTKERHELLIGSLCAPLRLQALDELILLHGFLSRDKLGGAVAFSQVSRGAPQSKGISLIARGPLRG